MFDEVVVAVDFGPSGLAAIALAQRLVTHGGRLLLTNVVMSDPVVFGGKTAATVSAEQARAEALLERERQMLEFKRRTSGRDAGLRIELCCVPAASTGRGLGFVSQQRGADLIVVGAPAPSRRGRVLGARGIPGVLRSAPDGVAIAIAPSGYVGAERPQTVHVVDADPEGERALNVARWVSEFHQARLVRAGAPKHERMSREADLLVTGRHFVSRRRHLLAFAGCPMLAVGAPVSTVSLIRSG
jgi:hypothetical protein